jgi:protein gp37
MGTKTGIAWTDHTFNPWHGCTKVSPGCDHCYAERDAHRFGPTWGHGEPRKFFGDEHWKEPPRWNRKAAKEQVRRRVFCASMADVFDNEVAHEHRERLWHLVRQTPHLDWLLLTKRVGNVSTMLPADWGAGYPNVWVGISVVNQAEVDRDIPKLLLLPAAIRFLSVEPMLGPVDLSAYMWALDPPPGAAYPTHKGPDWVIIGGESGPHARPMRLQWARDLVTQCDGASVACFVKQLGAHLTEEDRAHIARVTGHALRQNKGDAPDEWPLDVRVRAFPRVHHGA